MVGILFFIGAAAVVLLLVGFFGPISNDPLMRFILTFSVNIIIGLIISGIASIASDQLLQVIMQIEENTRPASYATDMVAENEEPKPVEPKNSEAVAYPKGTTFGDLLNGR